MTTTGGATTTVAAAVLDHLELEGVRHLFGVPGGALVAVLEELKARNDTLAYHLCRQETGAAYIADGYARVSGGLGVVAVTSGPGATNALTGAMNADASQSPLVVLTGEVATIYFGRGYLQEGIDAALDVVDVYRSALAYSEIVDAAPAAPELIQTALRVARGVPARAVHLSLPNDVAAAAIPDYVPPPSTASYRATGAYTDHGGIAEAVQTLAAADRPLLMLGDGCRRPLSDQSLLDDLVAAVEHLSVPVITGPDAKGVFPEDHRLALRNYGMAGCEWPKYYLQDEQGRRFDALVVLGSRLGELATNSWNPLLVPTGPFIQVLDDQRAIARGFPVTRGVVGEIGASLRTFVDLALEQTVDPKKGGERSKLVARIKTDHSPFADPEARTSPSSPIKPQALMRLLGNALPEGSHVFVDAGNCVGWCLNGLELSPPTRIHSALAMGPMGFAVGAVIGGKLAAPDATCVAVVGDGGFLMQVGEVATAAQYDVGAIWVVLADHDLTMVSQGMAHVTGDPSYQDYYAIGWSDLAAVAEGLGAAAYPVKSPDEAKAALATAIAEAATGVPQVVVAAIDPSEMPPYYPPPYPPPAGGGKQVGSA